MGDQIPNGKPGRLLPLFQSLPRTLLGQILQHLPAWPPPPAFSSALWLLQNLGDPQLGIWEKWGVGRGGSGGCK